MIWSDILFHEYFPSIAEYFNNKLNSDLSDPETIDGLCSRDLGWGLAMVLGTLIIVIAIAAELSGKLMDLFVKDWLLTNLCLVFDHNILVDTNYHY